MLNNYYVVDSFTDHVFGGGPAGVLITDEWLPDETMQNISTENGLADTAFAVRRSDGDYDLRWFMPKAEINLNGHATLAAGYCILRFIEPERGRVTFHTKSGELFVEKQGGWLEMELPAVETHPIESTDEIVRALGRRPAELWFGENYLAVYDSADDVRNLKPNFAAMGRLEKGYGVFVTAPGNGTCDIVDRAFWPKMGVDEDPVCGNMHCNLAPYWAKRAGKRSFVSHQLSPRGAEVICSVAGDRVRLRGKASLFLAGAIYL